MRHDNSNNNEPSPSPDRRDQFLLVMYEKLWDNIDRHIALVWQSAAVLGGATAVFALTEKGIVSLDVACTLLVAIAAWMIAHAYDASGWYNRNLAIIRNIERQFLRDDDERLIHPFFLKHRRPGLIEHLGIQAWLAYTFVVIILLYHYSVRVWPGHNAPWTNFEPSRALPYVMLIIAGCVVFVLRGHYLTQYKKLTERSPGAEVL